MGLLDQYPGMGYEGMAAPLGDGENAAVNWRRLLGTLAETDMAKSVASGAKLPGDVYSGQQPMSLPSQTEDLTRAGDLVGLMSKGASVSSMAGQIPKGAIGTFGSRNAVKAPHAAYDKALEIERRGATPADIWHDTGTMRDAEGNWAHEISDRGARMKNLPDEGTPAFRNVEHFADHPLLLENYPAYARARMRIETTAPGTDMGGAFLGQGTDLAKSKIELTGPQDQLLSGFIHEGEHGLQAEARRFGVGTDRPRIPSPNIDPVGYAMSPAERMARAAEVRQNYTDVMRRDILPWDTPDPHDLAPQLQKAKDIWNRYKGKMNPHVQSGLLKPGIRIKSGWM